MCLVHFCQVSPLIPRLSVVLQALYNLVAKAQIQTQVEGKMKERILEVGATTLLLGKLRTVLDTDLGKSVTLSRPIDHSGS